jgi:outer membrane protein assembly factor BamB
MPATPQTGGDNGWGMATVCYRDGFIYAASYNFETIIGEYNSHLVKLDAATGDLIWHVPSERSFSTPVVVADRIYLTGGIAGEFGGGAFGSVPKLMCFRDLGESASLEWDTTIVGGTTFHLVYAAGRLYAGAGLPFPLDFDYDDLYILDASLTPDDPDFIIDHVSGVGAGPALVDGVLYTIGLGGLFAFASPEPIPGDIDLNGIVNLLDFSLFAQCFGGCGPGDLPPACTLENWERSNLDGSGCITLSDFATFAGNFGTSQ